MEYLLSKIYLKGDKIIWRVIIFLFLFSTLVVFASADNIAAVNGYQHGAYWYFIQHLGFFAGGFILIFIFHRFPVAVYKNFATLVLIVSIGLLLYTSMYGKEINEAKRWISIAGIRFQPAEIAKMSVVLYLASVLEDNVFDDFRDVVKKIVLPVGTVCLLVFIEGTSIGLLFGVICISILFIGGLKLKFLFKILGLALIALVVLCISGITIGWPDRIATAASRLTDFSFIVIVSLLGITGMLLLLFVSSKLKHLFKICGLALAALVLLFVLGLAFHWSPAVAVADKIENVFKKNENKNTGITQADRGKIAVASGGLLGKGPGNSSQRYLLPYSYSDFVFAIIVEEYGLVTGSLILLAYMVLLYRAAIIAKKCTRIFSSVTVLGLMLMIVFQAMVNMGVSVGIFPVTGQTLPFVSHGGTSILCTGITFGIILSVSRAANNQEISKQEDDENGKKYMPNGAGEKITEYNE
ncbi:MAG: FtsW/RodA/SpoVE family cell cycle protein [Prevotellaceae bacterium]|jgi:cell division protein FtsW|nr:FtsW/RodA/SpoVE family cell cycle protein [Prevotellaceae bacterium]